MSKSTQITKRLTAKIPTRGNDVTTLGDASVTTGKLADLSVSTPKLQDQSVTGVKLANDTVDFVGKHLRNYTINGNFDFWQRATSFSSVAQFNYWADRWANQSGANTSVTVSQQALNGTQNATYCLRWTAGSTSSQFNLTQALESIVVDQLKGKTVTFSIYARINSGNVRTYSVQVLKNSTGNTLSGGSWTNLGSSTPTALSTSFQKLSVTVTIPNDGTANGLRVDIFDNQTGLAADYIEVVGAMLNEGSYAAPFKMYGANHVEEFNACLRFLEYFTGYAAGGAARMTTTSAFEVARFFYKVRKRANGTLLQSGTLAANSRLYTITGVRQPTGSFSVSNQDQDGFGYTASITTTETSSTTCTFIIVTAGDYLGMDCELT